MKNSDSSLGAAMLAGVASGVFAGYGDAVEKCMQVVSVTTPDAGNTQKYAEIFVTYKKIHDALAPVYSKI
jgi:xylulokinase